jgi:hypothetical protein
MKFEWDAKKNRNNIRKHGLDFRDAEQIFAGAIFIMPDVRNDYGEKRWKGVGTLRHRTVAVVFAEFCPDTIRIISLRKADYEERQQYEKAIQNGLETC